MFTAISVRMRLRSSRSFTLTMLFTIKASCFVR
jgi:hypothetical protein